MAIKLVQNGPTPYLCLSADVASSVHTATYPLGVTAHATDTNIIYRCNYNDGTYSTWVLMVTLS